ncbi:hypothetical protein [Brasilonema sp. UFV-L1]|uniref:hypothetical protein n=1 Tax=Brasilonema sp. UFV-L1 TaxID=2234130 RepID=UPI00145DCCFC|nr:hypothetical protein [Brasilonema sp. UFV-L1]NMG10589.1 hypothetical protein [Brasilonema sp. UFV-L1]
MTRATETERINVNIYIDKTVAQRLHEFARQQAMWKGRLVEAAIVEYLNKIERRTGTTFN